MHSHHDKTRGWQPFWAALGAALLVLLPLVGGTILLTRQSLRTRLAAKPQSGVAVRMPKTENQLTLLVCTAGEQPGFVLLYLNASQNCIRLAALPAETAIPFGQGEATLAQCYAAAGPARCREALLEPLALPETTRYLALSPSVLAAIADRYGMLRVGFSGALTADELAQCGLSAREAQSLFSGWDKDGTLPPSHRAAARAAVWDAFFRQDLELLPTTLPAALRAHSSELLTDLTAQDFLTLESTLEFLANGNAAVSADALPGAWNPTRRFYGLTDASRASVQTLFNVWPTEAQAASSSEP